MAKCIKCGKETGLDWKKLCEDCFKNEKGDLILRRQLMGKAIDFFTARGTSFDHMLLDEVIEKIFKLSDKWYDEAKKRGY